MKHECAEEVRQPQMMNRYRKCDRTGVVFREGKWWCKQHDPEAVKQRKAEKQKRVDAERDKLQREWNDRRVGAILRMDHPALYRKIKEGLK